MDRQRRVLLVGWSGADWSLLRPLVEGGAMPNLRRLIEGGVSGDLAAPQPLVGPMLWTSLLTGKRAHKHGVHGFSQRGDYPGEIVAVSATSRTTKALWNVLAERGMRCHCVNAFASHPAEAAGGVCVSNQFTAPPPLPAGCVYPEDALLDLDGLRVGPEQIDARSVVALVPDAATADVTQRPRTAAVRQILADTATVHNAATWAMEHCPWDFVFVQYDGLSQFSQIFGAHHPPRRPDATAKDAAMFGGVLEAAGSFFDLLLGRLVELAGGDTTIVLASECGTLTGRRRPAGVPRNRRDLSAWLRPTGVLVMKGPGIRTDELIEGASLLDLTPTVLTLFGLPVGRDMDGRVLLDAMSDPVLPTWVDSWDRECDRDKASERPASDAPADASWAAIRHLLALGYTEPSSEQIRLAERAVDTENQFNLARALIDAGRPGDAVPLLEPLCRQESQDWGYKKALFDAYAAAGRIDEAKRLVDSVWDQGYRGPLVCVGKAMTLIAERRATDALAILAEAERANPDLPDVHELIGESYLRLRRWGEAERALRRAAELTGGTARTWDHRAVAALGSGDPAGAAAHALHAVGLRADFAPAHYHLGVALRRLSRPREAAVALERCVGIRRRHLPAWRQLAELYDGPLADPARAADARWHLTQAALHRRRHRLRRGGAEPASP